MTVNIAIEGVHILPCPGGRHPHSRMDGEVHILECTRCSFYAAGQAPIGVAKNWNVISRTSCIAAKIMEEAKAKRPPSSDLQRVQQQMRLELGQLGSSTATLTRLLARHNLHLDIDDVSYMHERIEKGIRLRYEDAKRSILAKRVAARKLKEAGL